MLRRCFSCSLNCVTYGLGINWCCFVVFEFHWAVPGTDLSLSTLWWFCFRFTDMCQVRTAPCRYVSSSLNCVKYWLDIKWRRVDEFHVYWTVSGLVLALNWRCVVFQVHWTVSGPDLALNWRCVFEFQVHWTVSGPDLALNWRCVVFQVHWTVDQTWH